MGKGVIIACDFAGADETFSFLDKFGDRKLFLKIGMELFYSEGPKTVSALKDKGHKIFLDLKLHDIPNTVKKAMAVISRLDADMTNVHAAGGSVMMEAALEGLTRPDGTRPKLIAVTQLTSTDTALMNKELLIPGDVKAAVESYAKNAASHGLDGVVCSPLEAKRVKEICGKNFLTVTPGVRFSDSETGDQKRVTTPERAKVLGADYIVMGRPVTCAEDPVFAYERAAREFVD